MTKWLKIWIQKAAGMKIKKNEESAETEKDGTTQILAEHEEFSNEQKN